MKYLFESVSNFVSDFKNYKIPSKRFFKRFILSLAGFSSADFDNYNLNKRKLSESFNDFVPYFKRKMFRGNFDALSVEVLQNKYQTIKKLSNNLIPTTTPQYLVVNKKIYKIKDNFEVDEETLTILAGDYVIKPINQRWGIGINFLKINDTVNFSNCLEIQESMNKYDTLLIENKEINHPQMALLGNSSLNTLRIVTVCTDFGDIKIIFACVRFSSNGEKIDNWSSGGFAANIDIETGVAQSATKKDRAAMNSNSQITDGFVVPYFEDAKRIAIRAHELFRDMKSIGWDIAVTPNGVIIIEGNDDWDVILPQKLLQKGIKKLLCKN